VVVLAKYGGMLPEQWIDMKKIKDPALAQKPHKELREICK
jgi:hypothetical protein